MLDFEVREDGFHPVVTPDEPLAPPVDAEAAEAAELLAKAGLDRVPTADEAKALLAARRAEIRHAVLVQADERAWCEDGTRKVCANLRLERPGNRTQRVATVELNLKVTMPLTTYTTEGVIAQLMSKGLLNEAWLRSQLYVREATITPLAASVDGETIDLPLIAPKPEVTA